MAEPNLDGDDVLARVAGLCLSFPTRGGHTRVVDGMDLTVRRGESVGLVGESGSGKSLTALTIMGLLPPAAELEAGSVRLGGEELIGLPPRELDRIRGRRLSIVFQSPRAALNPVMRVGDQVALVYRERFGQDRRASARSAVELLDRVRIVNAASVARQYPHELSGGMCQRVLIGMMMATQPELLIADEPTTALDVTTQSEILDLLRTLQEETGMGLLLITHDLRVVGEMCESVAVMFSGQLMEAGPTRDVFRHPSHPYTQRLLGSLDSKRSTAAAAGAQEHAILMDEQGCRFRQLCPRRLPECALERPSATRLGGTRAVHCHAVRQEVGDGAAA